jgi:hypothetical protein
MPAPTRRRYPERQDCWHVYYVLRRRPHRHDRAPHRKGRQLATLKEARTYITKLPKAEHSAAEWQAAMEALILVATLGGPTMMARIGVMRALNRGYVREFDTSQGYPLGSRN